MSALLPAGLRGQFSLGACAGGPDAWVLCGPDKASLRIGVRARLRDRLVALERLLDDTRFCPKTPLRSAYRQDRLDRARAARGADRMTTPTSTDVRARLVETLRRDLIGPAPGDTDLARERG